MFRLRKGFTIAIVLVLLFTLLGCVKGFYKYSRDNSVREKKVQNSLQSEWKMLENNNHIVLHVGSEMHEVYSITYNEDTDSISALSKPFAGAALDYYYKVIEKRAGVAHRKSINSSQSDIQQVHLFIEGYEKLNDSLIAFSKNDIFQVDVSESAIFLNALITTGIIGGSIIAGGIGFLFVVCGCPHVYVDNGNETVYSNTLFTGAKAVQLERFDYKEIPDFSPNDDSFSFQIINEEKEDQFTNMVEMISILHDPNLEVLVDKNGNFHTISEMKAPSSAVDKNGLSVLDFVNDRDEYTYGFDPDSLTGLAEIDVQFDNDKNVIDGKLIIRAKNTMWSGYVYDEFNSLFGKNHAKWVKMNKNRSKEEREKWMNEQGVKLLVDVKVNGKWESLDEVELVGEAALNQIVIPIPAEYADKNMLFRLKSGYKFWELDYVGLDYSKNTDIHIFHHKPSEALGNNGKDFTNELSFDDDLYMKHEFQNDLNSTNVVFKGLPVNEQLQRTFILKSKGYYISKSDYTGKTDRKRLKPFVNPGELSRFSKSLYDDVLQKMAANK